jgi:hypothetical protein
MNVAHEPLLRQTALAQASYHDLLRSLIDESLSAIRGTPRLGTRLGRHYWYDVYRVGSSVRKRDLGEDRPETAERIAAHRQLAAARSARDTDRVRLIRVLVAEGLARTDATTGSLLSALAQQGTFRLGGTVVGTHAFRLYEGELALRFRTTDFLQTGDLDIAPFERLSLALDDQVEQPLQDSFKALDFDPLPALGTRAVWRWRQTKSNTPVEFLTPSLRTEEDIRDLPALGVSAQSLHFLNYLITDPIKAVALYRSGVLVQIPRPERFAIHKLIVADRRRAGPYQIKSAKDRVQAAFLIRTLAEDHPDELRKAYADTLSRGPHWQDHIAGNLKRLPETAAMLAAL